MKATIYYYKYHDPIKNADYYHDPISNQVTWNFPHDSEVFDGETNEKISEPVIPDLKPQIYSNDISYDQEDSEDELRIFRTVPVKKKSSGLRVPESNKNCMSILKGKSSNLLNFQLLPPSLQTDTEIIQTDTSINSYLPESYQNKKPYDIIAFLTKYTTAKKKHLKHVSHFFSYQETSKKHIPILKATVDENLSKPAINCFDSILEFCSSGGQSPEKLLNLIGSNKFLIDEVYIQLLKQTHKNENKDMLLRTWYLILLMTTLFNSSTQHKPLIQSQLAEGVSSSMREISRCALLSYLRFVSFHTLNDDQAKPERYMPVITSETHGFSYFHTHLLEIMYQQKNKAPDCPIPLILWAMVYFMIKNKGFETQKIFIKSGEREKVALLAQNSSESFDGIKKADPENLSGLMKKWISELGQPLVLSRLYKEFEVAPDKSVDIVNRLPQFNRFSVMYIIGFLQEFLKHKEQTKVDEKFILSIFGGLLFPPVEEYSFNAQSCLKIGKLAVKNLIDNWDTKEIYPLSLAVIPNGLL